MFALIGARRWPAFYASNSSNLSASAFPPPPPAHSLLDRIQYHSAGEAQRPPSELETSPFEGFPDAVLSTTQMTRASVTRNPSGAGRSRSGSSEAQEHMLLPSPP